MRNRIKLTSLLGAVLAVVLGVFLVAPGSATAGTPGRHHHHHARMGMTTVTTAPGIASALLKSGIVPLPTRGTEFRLSYKNGIVVSYGFPVTGGNPDLTAGTGDILHSGGINFVSDTAKLEVGKFDIDLKAGKIYATEVNHAPARVAILDLNLSDLKVSMKGHRTTLTGISLNLDPAAASALNATFGSALPTDGSLVFGSAKVVLIAHGK